MNGELEKERRKVRYITWVGRWVGREEGRLWSEGGGRPFYT